MAQCNHGNVAPDLVIKALPICQAGTGRHKCAVCAYAEGVSATTGKSFRGPGEQCDQEHGTAPLDMLRELPESQAGLQRHKCVYEAFEAGVRAGLELGGPSKGLDEADESEVQRLKSNREIPETEKEQLLLARIGQGKFRKNVSKIISECIVTGVKDARFLIASHIKPWRVSNNEERLDGFNGLLLAPHVDLLFDRGYISFEREGKVMPSPQLPFGLLDKWHLGTVKKVAAFHPKFEPYLNYHREHIYRA